MILDTIKKFIKIKEPVVDQPIYQAQQKRQNWAEIEKERVESLQESLKEREIICPKCNGIGSINKIPSNNFHVFKVRCPKCLGEGKLDWVENVVGKKPTYTDGTCITRIDII